MCKWLNLVATLLLYMLRGTSLKHCDFPHSYCNMSNLTLDLNCIYHVSCNIQHIAENSFSIDGRGSVIICKENFGLVIENVPKVFIRNVTFKSCGMITDFNKTSAITIASSTLVSIDNMMLTKSRGTGLSLFHCRGTVIISGSTFTNNWETKNFHFGGGGVYIESGQNCRINISSSNFTHNRASDDTYQVSTSYKNSGGGGLYLNLISASNFIALVEDSYFINNIAHRGGGLYLRLQQNCTDNEVTVSNCVFTDNKCTTTETSPITHTSSGGAIGFLDHSNPSGSGRNRILIENSFFENNMAYYGGGIEANMGALHTTSNTYNNNNNIFIVRECTMTENAARVGSAINLFCYTAKKPSSLCLFKFGLTDLNLTENKGTYRHHQHLPEENTYSTLHLEMVTVNFTGQKNFIHSNNASGIGLNNAQLIIATNARISIKKNSAVVGGGIAVVGSSIIFLQPSSSLILVGNYVTDRGGAIYAIQTLDTYIPYSKACFIKYLDEHDSTHVSPTKWDVNVTVKNNMANGKLSSIFASSIYPCVWEITKSTTTNIEDTFCNWKNWFMDDNCNKSIHTLPQNFSRSEYQVSVYPNNLTDILDFNVVDDFNHTVTDRTIFSVCTLDSQQRACDLKSQATPDINRGKLEMGGEPNNYSLLVQTVGFRSISTKLEVELLECPVGYHYNKTNTNGCECAVHNPIVNCRTNSSQLLVNVLLGHCIGYLNGTGIVFAKCPYNICPETITNPYIKKFLPENTINRDFCKPYDRRGPLCKECRNDHGINVFSPDYRCIKCNNLVRHWITGISAVLVPQIIFLTIIIVFHIGITSPSMNGYIFFSHVSLLPVQVLLLNIAWKLDLNQIKHHDKLASFLTKLALDPYRLWTFDYPEMFEIHACFYPSFRIMHAIAFQYLKAFFPTVLLLITLLLIELHARNCKPVVQLWRPMCYLCIRLRRTWELRTSVIDALATVVLLSYSKIINTSIALLRRNSVKFLNNSEVKALLDLDTSTYYLEGSHIYFAATAIFILLTFGLVPPVLLTLYPYKRFKRLIGLVKLDQWHGLYAFVETFQGCYKDGTNSTPDRRWFAGMYFIFRIIIFLEFAFISDLSSLFAKLTFTYIMFLLFFITFRPYKKDFYNYLDGTFLIILASINLFIYYLITYAQQHSNLFKPIWHFTYVLLLLPTLYLLLYVLYLTCTRSKYLKKHCLSKVKGARQRSYRFLAESQFRGSLFPDETFSFLGGDLVSSQAPLDNLSEVPDRIDHPQRYSRDFDDSHRLGSSASFHKPGRVNSEARERLL